MRPWRTLKFLPAAIAGALLLAVAPRPVAAQASGSLQVTVTVVGMEEMRGALDALTALGLSAPRPLDSSAARPLGSQSARPAGAAPVLVTVRGTRGEVVFH